MKKALLSLLLLASTARAESARDLALRNADMLGISSILLQPVFSAQIQAALGVLPQSTTASLPGSCSLGQLYFDTTAASVKYCSAVGGTWTVLGTFTGGTITSPILAANGSAGAPSYSFTNFTTTGVWVSAGPSLNFEVGGTLPITMVAAGLQPNINGSAAAPVIANANFTTTGLYWAAGPNFGITVNGVGAMTFLGAGSIQLGAADAAAPVAQTLQAQSVVAGTTNVAGTNWTRVTSKSTGTGNPGLDLLQSAPPGATGTVQNTPVTVQGNGAFLVLANSTATTIAQLTVASNTTAAAKVVFGCTVFNGTDVQAIAAETICAVTNKAGTIANNTCTANVLSNNPVTSGTLTGTVTITAANPALVQLNCSSSLTPNAGFPLARYDVVNLGSQAMTVTQ